MDYNEKVIAEYVTRSQGEYSADHSLYSEYLVKMNRTPLDQLNEINVAMIIKPFLYQWGRMGRVLGQKEFRGWEENIAEQVHSNCKTFERFRECHLLNTSLPDFKQDIIKVYESFRIVVDRVAATKALHLICPNFFPLWDNAIKQVVKAEVMTIITRGFEEMIEKDLGLFRENIEDFSGQDYYIYMGVIQYFIQRYKKTFLDLGRTYDKGAVKVVDDLLWMMAHRPLSLFFRESSAA